MDPAESDRDSVLDEIRLAIMEALREGDTLRPEKLAQIITAVYPQSGFEEDAIAAMVRRKAVLAGVKVAHA